MDWHIVYMQVEVAILSGHTFSQFGTKLKNIKIDVEMFLKRQVFGI